MESNLFIVLSLVIVVAIIVSALMRILRQPLIMGYILTGVLVGPSVLHLIPEKAPFETFSSLGIALLLFIIGLGLSTTVMQKLGKVVLLAATVQIILSAAIAYGIAVGIGFTPIEALITGVALTFSSTIIIIKLINDKREQNRLYAQVSIGILLVQDIVASIALVLLAAGEKGGLTPADLGWLALKGLGVSAVLIFVSGFVLPRFSKFIASSQEFLFLFALAWGFGIATLFELAGFSIEVGALFAGVSLASLPYAQEVAARLKPLRDFFVVVFFIVLGEGLELNNIGAALLPAIVFSAMVILAKPLTVLATMGLLGYTKRTSFKTAVSLGQVSEFSLVFVVLAASSGLVPAQLSATITLVAIITIAVSTYLMKYDDQIFAKLENSLRFFENKTVHTEQSQAANYSLVLFGYNKGGQEFIKSFQSLHKNFVIVDYDPEVIETLERKRLPYLYGDATDLELLQEVGIEKVKLVVSTITDHPTNISLVKHICETNPHAIVICHSDDYDEAAELYQLGATYVMMPHFIGSEKISTFIRRAGLSKREFAHYRDKHLMLLEHHSE